MIYDNTLGIDPELIEQSALTNVAKVDGGVLGLLTKEALMTADSKMLPEDKLHILMGIASEINEMVTPNSACRTGCNHCCKQAVSISYPEAKRLAEVSGKKMRVPVHKYAPVGAEINRAETKNITKYRGKACPFTASDGSCSVYSRLRL